MENTIDPCCTNLCAFKSEKTSGLKSFSDLNILVRNYLLLKNSVTSEGAVFHNVLYYKQLSIARYQVSFYANIHF